MEIWKLAPPFIYFAITVASFAFFYKTFDELRSFVGTRRDTMAIKIFLAGGFLPIIIGQILVTLEIMGNNLLWKPTVDKALGYCLAGQCAMYIAIAILAFKFLFIPEYDGIDT